MAVVIRRYKAKLGPFLASLIVSVLLFGSVETYFLSYFRYGYPLGPRAFVKMHSNRDGIAGALRPPAPCIVDAMVLVRLPNHSNLTV